MRLSHETSIKFLKVMSILFLVLAVVSSAKQGILFVGGERVVGQVIELTKGESDDSAYPKVEFQTVEGEKIVFTSMISSSPPQYNVGDQVPVIYDKKAPQKAQVFSGFYFIFFPLLFVLFSISSYISLWFMKRFMKRA